MTELKRAQKNSYSSFERIAVYKRYKILGENELARKVIERAYKSLPENNEICAVYADILISENRQIIHLLLLLQRIWLIHPIRLYWQKRF